MKKHLVLTLVALLAASVSFAQGRRGLRINEIMVQNDSNVVDDYGQRGAWVELFNSTFGPLEISSVYITDDPAQPKKYPVPLGDVNTEIPARQHVLFWADGKPSRGTFHMSFTLRPGQDNWIGVYDADGKTLIDEVTVPANLPAGHTYARKADGEEGWEVRTGLTGSHITPSSNNIIRDTNVKVDMFKEKDEQGFGMTIMAMCIVFTALLLLSVCFYLINRIGAHISKINKMHSHGLAIHETPREERPDHDSSEEIAAIVMALHEHLNSHDQEQTVLTINKVKRAYSPWSSKIYNLRELPRR